MALKRNSIFSLLKRFLETVKTWGENTSILWLIVWSCWIYIKQNLSFLTTFLKVFPSWSQDDACCCYYCYVFIPGCAAPCPVGWCPVPTWPAAQQSPHDEWPGRCTSSRRSHQSRNRNNTLQTWGHIYRWWTWLKGAWWNVKHVFTAIGFPRKCKVRLNHTHNRFTFSAWDIFILIYSKKENNTVLVFYFQQDCSFSTDILWAVNWANRLKHELHRAAIPCPTTFLWWQQHRDSNQDVKHDDCSMKLIANRSLSWHLCYFLINIHKWQFNKTIGYVTCVHVLSNDGGIIIIKYLPSFKSTFVKGSFLSSMTALPCVTCKQTLLRLL